MRVLSALMTVLVFSGLSRVMRAQSCTGLCLEQVSCPSGQTTSISGKVYAPNGVDPLPNVLVYIPNAPVDAFTPGVSCPVVGQPPSGSPLVGTTSAVDGSFTITNVPVGTNIPLVIQSGRWRRQVTVPTTTACTDTAFSTRMPKNQSEGDIPKFAVVTGSQDEVECVLRKVGVDDAEFTDPGGTGRISMYVGSGSGGAQVDGATPSQDTLMSNPTALNAYDVLMLPCQGKQFEQDATALATFMQFANAGGRVYASHFSYVWMYDNPPFNGVANWDVNQKSLPDGTATVDTSFSEGQTLSQWLQLVGASTTLGQIAISTLKHDLNGVVKPTQSWLTLNDAADGNPVMQFVFDAPVSTTANQCGRVLFNEYHVETKTTSPTGVTFPNECTSGAMTPQEKLLEFSLFELTNNGGAATLTPTSQDFGSEAVGFPSAAQSFTWTNNSTFASTVTLAGATGDFQATGNNCSSVAAGASCTISVVFTPTALGARTGTLSVGSGATTLTASLTGTGTPDLTVSPTSVGFGNVDVGNSATQTVMVTNIAPGAVALPLAVTSSAFGETKTCGASIAAGASCTIAVTFRPATTGTQTGSLTASSGTPANLGLPVALTGNGVDFTLASSPSSGSVIAGDSMSMNAVTAPIAGFANAIRLTCTTNAPASTCTPASAAFVPSGTVSTAVNITTISKYTVIGYGGMGAGNGWLWLIGLGSTWMLWAGRRRLGRKMRGGLVAVALAAGAMSLGGCSGKLPALNPEYTAPGSYTYTLTATDGFLTHPATFTLKVTAK